MDNDATVLTRGNPVNPSLVLLHGFMGCARDWDGVARKLENTFHIITPDLPGHGSSVNIQPTFKNAVQLLRDVVENNAPSGAHLCGYSLGGRIALAFALENPQAVRRLVLESAAAGLDENERAQRLEKDKVRAAQILKDFPAFLNRWYGADLFGGIARKDDFPALLKRRLQQSPDALARAVVNFSPAQQKDYRPRLAGLNKEVLLIHGEGDKRYARICHEMQTLNPSFKNVSIANAAHNVHFEQPGTFAQHLKDFLTLRLF